jgi:hypothetical protein
MTKVKDQVDSIVDNLVKDIESRLNARVDQLVQNWLGQQLEGYDYESKLNWLASLKLDNLIAGVEIDKTNIEKRLDDVTDIVVNNIEAECRRIATESVRTKIYNDIDVKQLVYDIVSNEISRHVQTMQFPERSISGKAINPAELVITGDNVQGGTIQNFSSTGIDDRSTEVQMTIMDAGVVIENRLITQGLEIHGSAVIKGNIEIEGTVDETGTFFKNIVRQATIGVHGNLNENLFTNYSNVIFEQIKRDGLDLNTITLNGTEVIKGNQLNYGISDTNITRLGIVTDLQSKGETYLSQTLYVGKNKVGIGTIEPAHSLSVWDQEVEVGIGKRSRDVGWIGTARQQDLIISANNKDNIVLKQDGSIEVQQIRVNNTILTSSATTPNYDAPRGTVAFNEQPAPGTPVGWISLGSGVWSKFGLIG